MRACKLLLGCSVLLLSSLFVENVSSESSMHHVSSPRLSIERLYASPALEGSTPLAVRFSPDSRRVTFLKGKEEDYRIQDLWEYDIESGQERLLVDSSSLEVGGELSEEEKARRERKRQFASGIVEYVWHPEGKALLFPLNGAVFLLSLEGDKKLQRITDEGAFATDVKFSPKGRYISFVQDQNLWVFDTLSATLQPITDEGGGLVHFGTAEFVAQEEMGRDTGYWWSGDDRYLAYTKVDESQVAVNQRPEFMADELRILEQRYPYTGTPNAKVDLLVRNLESGHDVWIQLGDEDQYLARVNWMPDNRHIGVQLQLRDQKSLGLFKADVQTGLIETLLIEKSEVWVELHDELRFLKQSDSFIWASAESGYKHLYLHDAHGKRIGALTEGDWPVKNIVNVNEEEGRVYFLGFAGDPLQQHLYSVSLKEMEKPQRHSQKDGWYEVQFSKDGEFFIATYSNPKQPPQVSLHQRSGARLAYLEENALTESHPFYPYLKSFSEPEFGSIEAQDGQTLFYKITRPTEFDPNKQYPAVVFVYGGPHARKVTKQWDRYTGWTQFMAQRGYVVFSLDNRGAADRGRRFEEAIHGQLGHLEIADQRAGALFLGGLDYVDAKRIGIFGWSYGGYATLMCLAKAGDVFSAGVSVAPVTDWKLYDTHYTERYLGDPKENEDAYEASSVFPYLDNLKGALLLVHGMADDNVLFTHSTRLIKELQDRDISFETQVYPGSKHGIAERSARVHLFNTMTRFFDRQLKGV